MQTHDNAIRAHLNATDLEKYKPVVGFENTYIVSSCGNIIALEKKYIDRWGNERILKPYKMKIRIAKHGYCYVGLRDYKKRDKQTYKTVHRIVAEAFLENKDNKKQVNHKDGNKKNNNVNNLEWATSSENIQHALNNKLYPTGSRCKQSKLNEKDIIDIFDMRKNGNTCLQIAKIKNVSVGHVNKIVNGKFLMLSTWSQN